MYIIESYVLVVTIPNSWFGLSDFGSSLMKNIQ
jgi:hypothetical protein